MENFAVSAGLLRDTLFDITEPAMCPNCGEQRRGQTHPFVPFTCSTPLALSVLAETILAELPEYGSSLRKFLPARGRRLLAFTDGRQGAARLGPRLTSQHERQVLRAALAEGLPEGGDLETIAYLEDERQRLRGTGHRRFRGRRHRLHRSRANDASCTRWRCKVGAQAA